MPGAARLLGEPRTREVRSGAEAWNGTRWKCIKSKPRLFKLTKAAFYLPSSVRTAFRTGINVWFCLFALALPGVAQWRTGYFMQREAAGQTAATIPWSKYTHVVHSALRPAYSAGVCDLDTTEGLLGAANIEDFVNHAHAAGVKAIIGISQDDTLEAITACTAPQYIAQFVEQIRTFVANTGYDGVDLDWESPIITPQFQDLVRRLRTALPTAILSVAVGSADRFTTAAVQYDLDQINIRGYDLDSRELAGNPVNYTWYHSPALQRTNTPDEAMRILVWDFVYAGNAWSKLGLAVPFYGRIKTGCLDETGTTGVTDSNHPWLGGTESRSIPYRDLVTATHWSLGAHVWDESHSSQYIQDLNGSCATDTFIPSAGPDQLRAVAGLVRATRLGGIATYGLPYEYMARHVGDARYPLSTALYDAIIESYTGPLTTPPYTSVAQTATKPSTLTPISPIGAQTTPRSVGAQSSATSTSKVATSTGQTFTYYVDSVNGLDSNPGTLAKPWKTIAKVNSTKLTQGQSVGLARGGVWREALKPGQGGSPGSPITYGAYGAGANPLLDGAHVIAGFVLYRGSIYAKTGLTLNPLQVFQDNARLIKKTSIAAMVAGSYYWDGTNVLYVWATDSADPSGHTVETSGARYQEINFNGQSYITVSSIDVTKSGQTGVEWGLTSGSNNVTVSNSTSSWNGQKGFHIGGVTVYGGPVGNNNLISDSIAHDNIAESFWIGGGTNNGCLRCEAYNGAIDNVSKGYNTSDIGGVLIGSGAISNFVKDSQIHDIYKGYALMVEHENHANVTKPVGTILSGNTIAQNAAILASVVVEQGQDSLYEYNTIYTSGAGGGTLTTLNSQGGYATGSVSASFYNNTLYLGVTAFGNGLELDTASNPIFENNIVFTANPGTWNGYIVSLPATGVTGLVSDYNNLSDSQYVSGSTYATSLAAWKTLSGQDAHSIDLNPLFIDAPGHNFALQGGSPCIAAGIFISGLSTTNPPKIGRN